MDFVIIYLITLMMENLVIKSSWLVKKKLHGEMGAWALISAQRGKASILPPGSFSDIVP